MNKQNKAKTNSQIQRTGQWYQRGEAWGMGEIGEGSQLYDGW